MNARPSPYSKTRILYSSISSLLALGLAALSPAQAGTISWDGGGVGGTDLGVAANWTGDILPSVSVPDTMLWDGTVAGPLALLYNDASLAGVAGNGGVNLSISSTQTSSLSIDSGANTNSLRMNNVTIDAGAGAFSLGDGANTFNITLGGAVGQTHTFTNNSSNTAIIGSDVVFGTGGGGAHTLALGGSGNWTLNNVITNSSGTVTVVKNDSGTLTLTGTNTYTGGLVLNAGTLNINNNAAIGNTATGALTINGGTIDNTSGALVTTTTAKAQNWNGDFTFTGTNNLSFNGGVVTLGGTGGNRTVTVNAGTLTEGSVSGIGYGLTKAGAGTLTLGTAVSRITGDLNVTGGTLNIGVSDLLAGGLTGSGTVANGSASLKWFYINNSADKTFSGVLQNGGSAALGFNKSGAGTMTLTGLNTYTGQTTVNGGTLEFGSASTAGITQSVSTTQTGLVFAVGDGTVKSSFNGTGTASLTFGLGESRTAGATANFVISGGTNGVDNRINLTKAAGFMDQGTFFGGTNYAWMDGANTFVRAINYLSDTGAVTSGSTTSLGSATHQEFTGDITAQGTATFTTLKDTGNNAFTLAAGATVTTNGILKTGNVAGGALISGGTGIQAASGAELVIRTAEPNDALTISTPILANGTNALTKSGAGTLTLSGANTYTGATTIDAGTLNLTGTTAAASTITVQGGILNISGTVTAGTSQITATGASNSVINILPGASISRNNLFVGNNTNGAAAVNQTGGTLTLVQAAGGTNFELGAAINGYGYYKISGGTLALNEMGVGGVAAANTYGVMEIGGAGTVNNAGWLTLGRGTGTSSGVLNMSGGTMNFSGTSGGRIAMNWAGTAGAQSVLNLSNARINGPATGTSYTLDLANTTAAGTFGIANLGSNGVLQIAGVIATQGNPTALLNFNGGTLKATVANAAFMTSANVDGVFVYGGGGTIDNNGVAITISNALLAPTGNGVGGIAVSGGTGYIGSPMVVISGGGGTGATGYANIDASGNLTGITITNPGTGYTSTPTVVLVGGGGSGASVGAVSLAANTSGGMVFTGAGNTTFTGQNANSYSGGTTVNNGTLTLSGANNGNGIIRGTLNINPGATVVTTSANAFGYNVGSRVETVNINGGILNTTANGDQGWTTTFNLTGGTLTSNGGTSNSAAGSYWVLGRDNAGAAATGINTLASATTSNVAGRLNLRADNGNSSVTFNVADGSAATDLLVSAAITETAGSVAVNKAGAGRMEISGANTYTGVTSVNNGTLVLSGFGSINSSGSINVLGASSKFVQTSSTPLTPVINVTGGTVDGIGQISTVNVAGGTIANGNGTTGALSIDALTFSAPSVINLSTASTFAPLNTSTLTTGGNTITVNATNTSWANGQSYDLISYLTLNGALANFTRGSIANLGARQSATLGNSGSAITLTIGGDLPVWTGLQNTKWTTATVGGLSNWKLQTSGTPTDFLTNDTVLFDDSATGTTVNVSDANVNPTSTTFDNFAKNYTLTSTGGFGIASGTLIKNGGGTLTIANPNTYTGPTTINAGTVNITGSLGNTAVAVGAGATLNLQAANAITQNVVTVDGAYTQTVNNALGGTAALVLNVGTTLTNANNHSGGTTLSNGQFILDNGAAVGTGTLSVGTITLDSTVGVTLTNNNAQIWTNNGALAFTGTTPMNLGTGTISLGADASAGNFQLTNNSALPGTSLTVAGTITSGTGGVAGAKVLGIDGPGGTVISGSIVKGAATSLTVNNNVAGTLTLSGPASSFTTLNINGGASSVVELGAGSMTLANGGVNILQSLTGGTINATGGGSLVLGSNAGDFGTAGGTTLTVNAKISGSNGVDFWNANGGTGMGTIILTAANTYTGATNVENTQVILPASGAINALNVANVGQVTVGDVAGMPAVLNITGGTINATKNTIPSFAVGSVAGSLGATNMTSGTINTTNEFHLGRGAGGYAAFSMSGGTVNSGSWLVVGLNNDRAVLTQTGGTINVNNNRMTIGAGGNGSIGDVNLAGGTLNVAAAAGNNTGVFIGENGTGSLTISGNAALNLNTTAAGNSGTLQFGGNASSLAGVFNLNGGTATAFGVTKGNSTATAVYQFNFNGGTLKANASNAAFFASLPNTTAYVRGGGAIIDDGGFAITVAQPLLAPTGNGIAAINVSGGTGYIGAPVVQILGDGTGATAIANVDASGNLTGITVTSPGVGYTFATVNLFGGGGSGAAIGSVDLAANIGGGFTKKGNGVLTLTGVNTYPGPTVVNTGTLVLTGSVSGSILVKSGATFDVSGVAGGFSTISGQTLGGDGTVTGTASMAAGSFLAPGQGVGTLTFGGNLSLGAAVAPAATGALQFELGASGDKVVLTTGLLDIGSDGLAFDDFAFTAVGGFGGGTYTLFDTNTTIAGTLDPNPDHLTGLIAGQTATLSFGDSGRDLVLTIAVPEPGTSCALLAGLGLLVGVRRRRTA